LALGLEVAAAVQHAHQALIVHRDLKPSNILVAESGEVKLLDFGIAKLLDPSGGAEDTTQLRALTPAYASPEQIRGERVTVGSDVYSLGVVLYRLLAGREPFDLRGRSPGEIERLLMEQDPEPPSRAARRAAAPGIRERARALSGDLDLIVLKALGKRPEDRYPSIAAMADDLRHHLEGRPVLARPATLRYRLAKFIRRHRPQVTLAATAFVALVLLTGWYLRRLASERDYARSEAAKAAEVAGFLRGLFQVSDPALSRGDTVTARELLDRGAARIGTELAGQPEVQIEMMRVIGEVYQGLGLNDEAEPLLREALERSRARGPGLSADAATSALAYGVLLQDMGRFVPAESLLSRALEDRRRLFGAVSPEVSEAEHALADLLETRGRLAPAESLYRAALAHDRRLYPPGDPHITESLIRLGGLLRRSGRLEAAEPLLREGLAEQRKAHGDRDLRVASTARNLASLLRDKGAFAEAESLYQEVLRTRRQILGELHPETENAMNSYALLLQREGKVAAALAATREVVRIEEQLHPAPHPSLAAAYSNLGFSLLDADSLEAAATVFQRAMAVQDKVLRADHPLRSHPLAGLAAVRMAEHRFAVAEPLLRRALALRVHGMRSGSREIAEAETSLGDCLVQLHRYAEAESLLVAGYQGLRAAVGATDHRTERALERVVDLYDRWDQPDEARRYRLELPPDSSSVSR
ncbi:MAG TPA: serine/threonine-protein kinase, partial [Gemmatimonadales bacterium]|nr:serine/threonine-protein kinase [Gemmatimonadales bacterium]